MFGLITHLPADASGVSDPLFRTFRMSCFSEPIGEVHGVEVVTGKKAKGYKGKPQDTATKSMVINKRDIFNLSTPLRDRAVVNDQVPFLHSVPIKLEDIEHSRNHGIDKGSPPTGGLFESIEGIFSCRAPLMPVFPAKTVDCWYVKQWQ